MKDKKIGQKIKEKKKEIGEQMQELHLNIFAWFVSFYLSEQLNPSFSNFFLA